ncbi:hypothetical protein [Candidatus Palauibacter sp.]|uniref:hypothetical protein n=1 Tax=Candidatus Palauibacter sp. TaxID=3101350 RepID=UPI003AF20F1A
MGERDWPTPSLRVAATLAILLAAILQGTASAQTQDPARDAYLDDTARRLVLGLKAARDTARLTIDTYTALIRERLGLEWPSPRRNRPWVHGERTARVRWSRDEPAVVHVLAARFRVALVDPEDSEFFTGLRTERFAADPLGDPFTFGFTVFAPSTEAEITTRSPLGPAAERYYQFRSGDTIAVRLSDGSTLRAVAVTVIPRYRSIRLVSAIMWIDAESFGLARVAYRLAKPVDREMTWRLRSGGRWSPGLHIDISTPDPASSASATDSTPDRPGFFDRLVNGAFNSALPRLRMDISTVVAEYGLWEMRHWLPRSVTWRGDMSAREGVTAAGVAPLAVPVMIDWTLEIEDIRERGAGATPGTPATAAAALRLWRQEGDSISGALREAEPGETVTITPADRQALVASDLLPPTVWEEEGGVDDAIIERIAAELAGIGTGEGGDRAEAPSPWLFDAPGKTLRLLRYNPVERVSVGTRLQRDFGWGRAAVTARVGTAGAAPPDIDLTLQRNHSGHTMLVSFYRSLRDGEPGEGGSTPGIYVSGDPEDFHWSHGAAVRFLPPLGERSWLSLRLFAEQDAAIPTDAKRNRAGAAVAWAPWWGTLKPGSFGGGGRASVRASAGDNPHVRAVVEGTLVIPLFSRLFLGLQAGTARVWGDPAPHDLWRIGASGRWLRGHAESVRGARVHMARVDLQRPIRFLRLSVFGDWASAGGDDFYAVGAGLVFMDGILRVDVARGLGSNGRDGADPVLKLHFRGDAWF